MHHPAGIAADPEHCVPFRIWGDDSGVFWAQKILCLLVGPAARPDNLSLDTRLVFAAISYLYVVDGVTLKTLYIVLQWSMTWLCWGVHPDRDHTGRMFSPEYEPARYARRLTPLAGVYRGILSDFTGDWKWQVEALVLTRYYGTNACCHLCRAHKVIARLNCNMHARNSHLRQTIFSEREFRLMLEAQGVDRSALSLIVGFSRWRCWVDAMHCLDLGVYQYIVYACLMELAEEDGLWAGGSFEVRVAHAYLDYGS